MDTLRTARSGGVLSGGQLGMNTGNPERSVFAVTCGVAATVLLAVLPGIGMAVILNRFVPMIIGAFVQWLIVRK